MASYTIRFIAELIRLYSANGMAPIYHVSCDGKKRILATFGEYDRPEPYHVLTMANGCDTTVFIITEYTERSIYLEVKGTEIDSSVLVTAAKVVGVSLHTMAYGFITMGAPFAINPMIQAERTGPVYTITNTPPTNTYAESFYHVVFSSSP
jgi:hypothetical protein